MRKIVWLVLTGLLLGGVYVFSPFYTAWQIREAVKSNNADYLVHRVDWMPVRETLKTSLVAFTLGQKAVRTAHAVSAEADASAPRPGFFSRLKARFGRGMVEGIVERYATPAGLKTLFAFGSVARYTGMGGEDTDEGRPIWVKVQSAWSRVRRAEFTSLTRFEMDMVDENDPTRLFSGTLEFSTQAAGWRLVELRVFRVEQLES